jgi:hypothetical protein
MFISLHFLGLEMVVQYYLLQLLPKNVQSSHNLAAHCGHHLESFTAYRMLDSSLTFRDIF